MNKVTEADLVVSKHGISYYIISKENARNNRIYGIMAVMDDDKDDFKAVENLFFTRAEAAEYCKWFVENEVYPISLDEVLSNIYHI